VTQCIIPILYPSKIAQLRKDLYGATSDGNCNAGRGLWRSCCWFAARSGAMHGLRYHRQCPLPGIACDRPQTCRLATATVAGAVGASRALEQSSSID